MLPLYPLVYVIMHCAIGMAPPRGRASLVQYVHTKRPQKGGFYVPQGACMLWAALLGARSRRCCACN